MTLSVALDTNVLARLLVNDDPAQADHLGLVWLQGEVESTAMGQWLARCPLALLAYDQQRYAERSSGMLWQWAASRGALQRPAAAVGHGSGWLAAEAAALGLGWHSPIETDDWLAALAEAAALSPGSSLNAYGEQVLETSFSNWCTHRLRGQTSQ
jgi:hypothetical protein